MKSASLSDAQIRLKQPTDKLLETYHDLIVIHRLRRTGSTDPRAELANKVRALLTQLEAQIPDKNNITIVKELEAAISAQAGTAHLFKHVQTTFNELENTLLSYFTQEPKQIVTIIGLFDNLDAPLKTYANTAPDDKKKTALTALTRLEVARQSGIAFHGQERQRLKSVTVRKGAKQPTTYFELYSYLLDEIAALSVSLFFRREKRRPLFYRDPAQATALLKDFFNQNIANFLIARLAITDCENQVTAFASVIPPLLESLSQLVPVKEDQYQRAMQAS